MIATPFASKWGCEKGSVEREGVSSLWAIVFAPYYVPDLIGWARRLDQSLSNDWTLHIFGNYNKTESLRPFYQESSLLELINKSRLFVEALPSQVIATENTDWITANMSKAQWKFYDNLMKNWKFWDYLANHAVRIFIVQLDAVLCSKSSKRIEDFFCFDIVGARWKKYVVFFCSFLFVLFYSLFVVSSF